MGARIPMWIGVLAGCGIVSSALILTLLTLQVGDTERLQEAAQQQRYALHSALQSLQEPLAAAENAANSMAAEPRTPRPMSATGERIDGIDIDTLPPRVQRRLNSLHGAMTTALERVAEYNVAAEQLATATRLRQQSLDRANANLETLTDRVTSALTEETSARHRMYAKFGDGPDAADDFRAWQASHPPEGERTLQLLWNDTRELSKQIAAVAIARDDRQLREDTAQQLRHAIDPLYQRLAKTRRSFGPAVEEPLHTALDRLATGVLGDGGATDQEHPNLLAAQVTWLTCRTRSDQIRRALLDNVQALYRQRDGLEQLLESEIARSDQSLQEQLHSVWLGCLVIGIVVSLLFFVLARHIRLRAATQITEINRARETAAAALHAQGLFIANMSHEIRTPMNGVLGMAEMLETGDLPDDQRQLARTIRSSAEALLTVINDILDFSKIQAGKLELDATDFDIRNAVEDALDLMGHLAAAQGIELLSYIEHRVPRVVHGDPVRLRQVLLNLIGNAIKFTDDGEVTVLVEVVRLEQSEVELHFSVSDTGIGIPPDVQSRLFQPFTQADSTTTRRFGGTGLGLTISKRLVELMGGEITVASKPGTGSTFSFGAILSQAEAPAVTEEPIDFSGHSVLIVDDRESNCYLLAMQLARWKMSYDAVTNAEDAMAALRSAQQRGLDFDIVLLDHHMPGTDGLELARIIDQSPLTKARCILLSSDGPRPPSDSLEELCVAAWLPKPVRQQRLNSAFRFVLSTKSRRKTIAAEIPDLGLHILVADDNAINQRVLKEMLRKVSCTVDLANNGREAVDMLHDKDYDLVLMDCKMPVMDGLDATRMIRLMDGPKAETPIVALTANVMPTDRQSCMDAGMDDFMSKPIKKEVLWEMLRRWTREGVGS